MITNYLAARMLDLTLRGEAYVPPTSLWIGLNDEDPGPTGLISSELVGGSYGRNQITFGAASSRSASSSSASAFIDLPATTITHLSIWDAELSGNMLWSIALVTPYPVEGGGAFSIASGDVVLSFAS